MARTIRRTGVPALLTARVRATGASVFLAAMLIAALLIAGPAHAAQESTPPDHGRHIGPASISNRNKAPASRPHQKPGPARLLGQQELANAVLGDALWRMWKQSDEHFEGGEFNHSINLDRIIVQGDPRNLDAYGNTAWLLWSTVRNDEAIAFLKQGLAANPDNYYMYDELGAHYLVRLNDPMNALPYYQQAVQFPCPFVTWHSLAHCYEKTNRWDKAVETWEATAKKYPDDPLATSRLERARAELAKHQSAPE